MEARVLKALETSLSPERLAKYITHAQGDQRKAMHLYCWNTAASAAFYGPLQGLEVALRNALHRALSGAYGPNWFDNPNCLLDFKARRQIEQAKDEVRKGGYAVDPPHIVATLSFGFWVSLLGKGGNLDQSSRKAEYEMRLWRPHLRASFPNLSVGDRRAVHAPLDYLRVFRNRIAHHEPIFSRHLEKDYESILDVTGWICQDTKQWIDEHARVPLVLMSSREAPNLRF